MKSNRLFKDLARFYDQLYSWVNYKEQAQSIDGLIKKFKKSGGNRLLEVACGTGKLVQYLKGEYSVTATDISPEMLKIARARVRGVRFQRADMVKFKFAEKFDIIICLGSSIGYVKTKPKLERTLLNFENHLKTGGVLIIEPWLTKRSFKAGGPHLSSFADSNVCVAALNVSKVKGTISILDFHYLIAEKDKGVRFARDMHQLGMFEVDYMLARLRGLGFRAHYQKKWLDRDRGLYIGVKVG
jgi:SAM-dependent methyltransferase